MLSERERESAWCLLTEVCLLNGVVLTNAQFFYTTQVADPCSNTHRLYSSKY